MIPSMDIIAPNGVKNVMNNLVLVLVMMEFALKICIATLMTEFAFYLVNLIRIVRMAIDALRVANV